MPNLTADPQTFGLTVFDSQLTSPGQLGARGVTADGRVFRLAKTGGVALVAGNMIQAPAQITVHQQLTPVAAAIGATTVVATLGAAAAAENLYAGGFAIIDTTPGNGYAYSVSGHAAVASSGVITLTLAEPLKVALTTSSRVSLQQNPYNGVIQVPVTTATGVVVGCAMAPAAISEWTWLQTWGPAPVLIAGTPAVNAAVSSPGSAAGAVIVDDAATAVNVVGKMMVTGVTGKNQAVFLTIGQ